MYPMYKRLFYTLFIIITIVPQVFPQSRSVSDDKGGALSKKRLTLYDKTPQPSKQRTYCNPLNIDYGYTPIPNFTEWGKHRATADPVIVLYKGDYYLFSTNQWGYWWSNDMLNWNFISRLFLKPYH